MLLAVLVATHWPPLSTLDVQADDGMHRIALGRHWLVMTALAVSDVGQPLVMDVLAGVAFVVLLVVRRFPAAAAVAVARLASLGLDSGTKLLIARPRPEVELTSAPGFSFPSGHAAGAATVFIVVFLAFLPLLARRTALVLGVLAGVGILAVGVSRVVLGVHYPSDVLAGICLGVACASGASSLLTARQA